MQYLMKTVEEWGILQKINFAISDNATNVQKSLTDIGWKHYGCFAHSLNLIVQKSLISITDTMDKVKAIVRHFKKNSVSTQKLLKYQINENANQIPKKLIQEIPTRWNSSYYMVNRIVELESAVRATMAILNKDLPIITNEEWKMLHEVKQILKPFDEVTTSLSGEKYMTGSSIIVMSRCLKKSCELLLQEDFSEPAKIMVKILKEELESRFVNVERHRTFSVCRFLDPRFKMEAFEDHAQATITKRNVQDMVANLIRKETRTAETEPSVQLQDVDKFSPWGILNSIVGTKATDAGTPLSRAIKEVDLYLQEHTIPLHGPNGKWNCPMQWWSAHSQMLPHLATLFIEYGNVVATSVPCERMFSKAGLIISERRASLKSSKVAQLMFLNINLDENRFNID